MRQIENQAGLLEQAVQNLYNQLQKDRNNYRNQCGNQ
jgi:hypothetical protein